jgi:gamma-glutamylaminecyclotransferase
MTFVAGFFSTARLYMTPMAYIFVYGSLKRGFKQHDRHMKSARFIAATRTKDAAYELVAVLDPDATDHYPSMKKDGKLKIKGEVYEITDAALASLDEYEGTDYNRTTVALENGLESYVYLFHDSDIETTTTHPRIRKDGDTAEWIVR